MCLTLHIRFVSFVMLKKSVHTKYLCLLSQKLFFSQAFLILAPVQMDLKYPLAFHTIELTELPPALEVFYLLATFLAICARFLQRLLKHFNGTAISTVLVLALESSFPVIIVFNWNDSESVVLYGSSLWYCHKLPDFSHPFIKIFSMLYLHIIYFPDEVNNLWTIF